MASRKIGAAAFDASSAARFILSSASLTSLPTPGNIFIWFSVLRTCSGNNIFTAASLKNPSVADNLSPLFCAPIESASFNPETIWLFDKLEDQVLAEDFFPNNEPAFLNIPLRDESFCANKEIETSRKKAK